MEKKKKLEWWRIVVGIVAIIVIVFLWVRKDLLALYGTMPKEELIPLMFTTFLVSLLKVAAIAGVIVLFRWIGGKISGKRK